MTAAAVSLAASSVGLFAWRKRRGAPRQQPLPLGPPPGTVVGGEPSFRAVLEAAPDAMITVAADGRITMVNSETLRLFGYERRELVGAPIEMLLPERLRAIHAAHREAFHREPRRRPMGLGPDLVARRKDGSVFPTEISLSPLWNDRGLTIVVVVRDITERRKAEEERAALVREQAARAEAELANRAKDEFLAVVSHELRTPLNAILGWAVMLQSQPSGPETVARALSAIERNARVQRQVIDDLLDVSAITAGKVALERHDLDLAGVIRAAEESLGPSAESKRIRLDIEIEPGLPRVAGDPRRLQQVFWNLLSNAVKFSDEGGRVGVRARAVATGIEVRVEDNGTGIDPRFLPHVFDRFRQSDASPARGHGGLGLGLAIVRELVDLHGGSVTAESRGEGQGASFTVLLPYGPPADEPGALAAAEAHSGDETGTAALCEPLRGVTALVVDDDKETLELIGTVLRRAGVDVRSAESGAEALRQLSSGAPDILISDIGMPGMDGYRLLTEVRRMGVSTPALALTAYGRPQDRERALAAGFREHAPKPVLPEDLLTLVARTMATQP
jgi:PAS domain S-box-containing protein